MQASVEFERRPSIHYEAQRDNTPRNNPRSCYHRFMRCAICFDDTLRDYAYFVFGLYATVAIASAIIWPLYSSKADQLNMDDQARSSYNELLAMTALLFFVSLFSAVAYFFHSVAYANKSNHATEMTDMTPGTVEIQRVPAAASAPDDDVFVPKQPPAEFAAIGYAADPMGMTAHDPETTVV